MAAREMGTSEDDFSGVKRDAVREMEIVTVKIPSPISLIRAEWEQETAAILLATEAGFTSEIIASLQCEFGPQL